MQADYAITFACFNAVDYTRTCIESLRAAGTPLDRVVVVDNGSSDATREVLEGMPLGGRIFNRNNLACGAAWNQGILHLQAEWTVVMNNDLVVAPGWVEALIGTAQEGQLTVVSPAWIDGPLDYDFSSLAPQWAARMGKVERAAAQHAICVCIHRSVFWDIGFFRAHPGLLGYEDTIFFHDLAKTRHRRAIVGSAWVHHFGSVTQKAMKAAAGKSDRDDLVHVNDRRLLQQSWLERKVQRWQRKREEAEWRRREHADYGMTLHGVRVGQGFNWV